MPDPIFTKNDARFLLGAGGICWITSSFLLSSRPAGVPPHSFRHSTDLMPLLGVGLLLLAVGLARSLSSVAGAFLLHRLVIAGAAMYLAGALTRAFGLPGRWEPLMPIGFLVVISGLLLYARTLTRNTNASRPLVHLLRAGAIVLLCFNDQFRPQLGVLFGTIILALAWLSKAGATAH